MTTTMTNTMPIVKFLCRICGVEDRNCVPVFGEIGLKQEIQHKVRECLPIVINETDQLPKQICLACLTKLEATYEFYQLCRQTKAEMSRKLDLGLLSSHHKDNEQAASDSQKAALCPICLVVVEEHQYGIGCDGKCQRWHHIECVNMSTIEYYKLFNAPSATWVCNSCQAPQQHFIINTAEKKLKMLSETKPIVFKSTKYSLTKKPEPTNKAPPVIPPMPDQVMLPARTIMASPTTYQPITTSSAAATDQTTTPATSKNDIYPESLIHVDPTSKQIQYHQRNENSHREKRQKRIVPASKRNVQVPKPMASPTHNSPPSRRGPGRESHSISVPPPKRSMRTCKFCNKQFTNDIIDHHVNLHLRQPFSTCIDCNGNFRTQQALDKHKCKVNEPIDLDADDEPICL